MTLDVDGGHLGFGDPDAASILRAVDVASDGQPGIGGGGGDQVNDDLMTDKGFAAPILADIGEQTVLNTVPLAGAGRQMVDRHLQSGLVGEALQLALPKVDAGTIAAAAVSSDDQALRVGIAGLAEPLPPATDALDREFRRVGIDADVDPALVGPDIVNPVGRYFSLSLNFEVVDEHRFGITLGAQLLAAVLKIPDELLFLRIDRNRWLTGRQRSLHCDIDVFELRIAIGMLTALAGLAVGLTAEAQLAQHLADELLAHLKTLDSQRRSNIPLAPAYPAQRRLRIAANRTLNETLERRQQARLTLNCTLASATGPSKALAEIITTGLQLGDAAIDRASRNPRRCRHGRDAAVAQRQCFIRSKQPTSAFVQESDDSLKSDLEGVNVNHCERPSDVVPQELANQKRESSRLDPRPGTRRYRIQLPRVNLTLSQAPAPVSPDSTISHRVLSVVECGYTRQALSLALGRASYQARGQTGFKACIWTPPA